MKIITNSAQETLLLGKKLGQCLSAGDIVALEGELGTGKTVLIQGICRGLKVIDEVSSPSYVLINEYSGKLPVYHFDVYRLKNLNEMQDLGYEEYFKSEGVTLIEWAEKIESLIIGDYLKIKLKYHSGEAQRLISFIPFGKKIDKLLERLAQDVDFRNR